MYVMSVEGGAENGGCLAYHAAETLSFNTIGVLVWVERLHACVAHLVMF